MIRCHLGDVAFFGGLQNYLEKFKYGNPTTNDLFDSWDEFIGNHTGSVPIFQSDTESICDGIGKSNNGPVIPKSAKETFNPWLRQMGYPFLRVKYTAESFGYNDEKI